LEDLHPLGGKNVLNMCDLFEDDYKEFVVGELTESDTGCFIGVPIWKHWSSKGYITNCIVYKFIYRQI